MKKILLTIIAITSFALAENPADRIKEVNLDEWRAGFTSEDIAKANKTIEENERSFKVEKVEEIKKVKVIKGKETKKSFAETQKEYLKNIQKINGCVLYATSFKELDACKNNPFK